MDTDTLREALESTVGKSSAGVFASDRIPDRKGIRNKFVVVNHDPHDMPGSHWVVIGVETGPSKSDEYFCSYGIPPPKSSNIDYYLLCNRLVNRIRLQSEKTIVCGQYCLLYILARSRGIPRNVLLSNFSHDHLLNDVIVNAAACRFFAIQQQPIFHPEIYQESSGCGKQSCRCQI